MLSACDSVMKPTDDQMLSCGSTKRGRIKIIVNLQTQNIHQWSCRHWLIWVIFWRCGFDALHMRFWGFWVFYWPRSYFPWSKVLRLHVHDHFIRPVLWSSLLLTRSRASGGMRLSIWLFREVSLIIDLNFWRYRYDILGKLICYLGKNNRKLWKV